MPAYRHTIVANAPAAKVFEALDFGAIVISEAKMQLVGDPKTVGSTRQVKNKKGDVVVSETQIYREIREDMMSHSYDLKGDKNMEGYVGTITVWPLSEEPNRCFVEWKGKWAQLNKPDLDGQTSPGGKAIGGMLKKGVAQAEGSGAKL